MSSETEQILNIQPPHKLTFKGPFTEPIQTMITLENPRNKTVAFKLKTNTINHLYIKPNCGEIAPKDKADILVTLQPFDGVNYKPKILVQSVLLDPVDFTGDGKTFQWKDVEVNRIIYFKLECSFDMSTVEKLEFQNICNESTADLESNAETELQTITEIKEIYDEKKNLLKQENLMLKEKLLLIQQAINNQNYQKEFIGSTWLVDMQGKKKKNTLLIGLTIVFLLGIITGKYSF